MTHRTTLTRERIALEGDITGVVGILLSLRILVASGRRLPSTLWLSFAVDKGTNSRRQRNAPSVVGRDVRAERYRPSALLQRGGERLDLGVSLLGPACGEGAPGNTRTV